jgi:hypothetical protein
LVRYRSRALGTLVQEKSREHFRAALALARKPMERRFLDRRLGACETGGTQRAYYEQFWETHFEAEDRI